MDWIYLSPHLDDAAFSCGGLIWDQGRAGESVSIWTVCAGQIPPGPISPFARQLHERWEGSREQKPGLEGEASNRMIELRQAEDLAACRLLSAADRHFDLPDCIYRFIEETPGKRTYLYDSRSALFGAIHPAETRLIDRLASVLDQAVDEGTQLVCPLGLGNHVDHQLTRMVAERLGRRLCYYADFPYTLGEATKLVSLTDEGWTVISHPVSPAGLAAWQASIAAYRSQISTFWENEEEMQNEVQRYVRTSGGVKLWTAGRTG